MVILFQFVSTLQTTGIDNVGTVDMVPIDMCKMESCESGCYNELVVDGTKPVLIDTVGTSFVGVHTNVTGQCGCRATDFSGSIACTPGYCYHGGTCTQDRFGKVR